MMRYAAIDIETTGLDPDRCQVLELACVIETDWRTPVEELPTFRRLVDPGEVRGDAAALAMNARLIAELATGGGSKALDAAVTDLGLFVREHLGPDTITIAGKNFGAFDYQFLRRAPGWARRVVRHAHRFVDVGNLWWRPGADARLPDLAECLRRAGLPPRAAHAAVEDCRSVVECVRAAFR